MSGGTSRGLRLDAVALELLSDRDAEVRRTALEAVLQSGGSLPLERLAQLVADPDERIRRLAVGSLRSSSEEEVELLRQALTDSDEGVRASAEQMLGVLDLEQKIARDALPLDVTNALLNAGMLALGAPAGEVTGGDPWDEALRGTESDLLHFTADATSAEDEEEERVYLPIFTRPDLMVTPLQNNPDWQELLVLGIRGADLLTNVDDDVTMVINPWSDLEYQLTPYDRRRFVRRS